jgi:hypothetical protein
MKKLVLAIATACAVAVAATSVALAGSGGTVVASGFGCNVLDGNGDVYTTTDSVLTVYSNQNGAKAVLQCEGHGAPAPALRHWNYRNTGLTCATAYGSTTWWDNKVGRAGHSQLTCTVILAGGEQPTLAGAAGLG